MGRGRWTARWPRRRRRGPGDARERRAARSVTAASGGTLAAIGVAVRSSLLPAAAGSLLLAAAGCASRAPAAPPADIRPGWTEEGVASWYGYPFHGRRTASGEIYDMEGMTAAHPWLPFGTVVRVESRETGRLAVVRVNDRGPFKKDRIIDLSRAAARALGMVGPGTARVRIRVEELPEPPDCLELQVGAFRDASNAEGARRRLAGEGIAARIEVGEDGLRRVLAGPFRDAGALDRVRARHPGLIRACR